MKAKKKAAAPVQSNGSHGYPTHEEIALCARAIWEKEGQPQGRELDHWLQAEAQLQQGQKQMATVD